MYLKLDLKMPYLLRVIMPGGEGGFGDERQFKEESGLEDGVCDGMCETGLVF